MRLTWLVLSCLVLLTFIGCGRAPQLSPQNRRLLAALQTAVSAQKTDWLEATHNQIAEKRGRAEISDEEYAALSAIIEKARAGDWKQAQADVFALSEGQRPTPEEVDRLKQPKQKASKS